MMPRPPTSTLFPYTTLFRSLVAEFIKPAQYLQVPVVTLLQSALRRMRGHREIAKFHGNFPLALLMGASCARKRSEEHTSELQSHVNLVCRLLLEKKKQSPPP